MTLRVPPWTAHLTLAVAFTLVGVAIGVWKAPMPDPATICPAPALHMAVRP